VSPNAVRWLIFLAAFATLPLPYFLPEGELAPAMRLVFLTGLMSVVYATEGSGPLAAIWGMAIVQSLLWTALLYWAASLIARALGALSSGPRSLLALSLVAALFALSLSEIYQTPLSSTRLRSDLLHLFE
jgi:hypothetical protein